jgi:hypothetical protein
MAPVGQMATQCPQSIQSSQPFSIGDGEILLGDQSAGTGPDASAAVDAQALVHFDHRIQLVGVFILDILHSIISLSGVRCGDRRI